MSHKVLIVEDDTHTRKIVEMVLEREPLLRPFSFKVFTAGDGEEGFTLFQQEKPELVITDLLMPKVDGYALLKKIRETEFGKKVPILVTTAVVRSHAQLAKLQRDYDVQVQLKPFNPRALADQVRRLIKPLGQSGVQRVSPSAAPSVTPVPHPQPHSTTNPGSFRRSAVLQKSNAGASLSTAPSSEGTPAPTPSPSIGQAKVVKVAPPAKAIHVADKPAVVRRINSPAPTPIPTPAPKSTPIPKPAPTPKPVVTVSESLPPPPIRAIPPRQGLLSTRSLVRLLIDCFDEQFSGMLTLTRSEVVKKVSLLNGYPIFVQSNLRSETLGQLLVQRGAISEEQQRQALLLSTQQGIKYGEALVALKLLTEEQVMAELVQQTRYKLETCFAWDEGGWSLVFDDEVGSKVPRCTVDPIQLVFQGLREQCDVETMAGWLSNRAHDLFVLDDKFSAYRDTFVAIFGEGFLQAIQGNVSLSMLLHYSDTRSAVIQLDVLLRAQMATIKPAPKVERVAGPIVLGAEELSLKSMMPPTQVDELEGSAAVSAIKEVSRVAEVEQLQLEPPPMSQELVLAKQLIEAMYLGLHGKDDYGILGVTTDTSLDGIEVAYQLKRKQFDLEQFRGLDLGPSYSRLEEICVRLDQAYTTILEQRRTQIPTEIASDKPPQKEHSIDAAVRAEELFQEGLNEFKAAHYKRAYELFSEASVIDEQAEYRAYEALAMFLWHDQGIDAAMEAMTVVHIALALDPQSAFAHDVAAKICFTLEHHDEALDHLKSYLHLVPSDREKFEHVCELLLERQDLQTLEQVYRSTIQQLGRYDDVWSLMLWKRLILFYRDRLNDPKKAALACEAATRWFPHDIELKGLGSQINRAAMPRWSSSVNDILKQWSHASAQTERLHPLVELHLRDGRSDAAYQVLCALSVLNGATAEQQQQVEALRPKFLKRATRAMDEELIHQVMHAEDDHSWQLLFSPMIPLIRELHPPKREDDEFEGERQQNTPLPAIFSSVLRYVCEELRLTIPPVSVRDEMGKNIKCVGLTDPLLVIGPQALILDDRIELCFRLTQALWLFGKRFTLLSYPSSLLKLYVVAALELSGRSCGYLVEGDDRVEVDRIQQELQQRLALLTSVLETSQAVSDELLKRDLSAWQAAMQRSAERLGLLLCTDLTTAYRVLEVSNVSAARDLVGFAISEPYNQLRLTLGLSVY